MAGLVVIIILGVYFLLMNVFIPMYVLFTFNPADWEADLARNNIKVNPENTWFSSPQFTPDGSHIVYAAATQVGKVWDNEIGGERRIVAWDIWIMDRDGTNQTPLTHDGNISRAMVSPAWDQFAYTHYDSGKISVFVVPTDGAPAVQIAGPAQFTYFSSWSPDGERMAVTGLDPSDCDAFTLLPDGREIPSAGNISRGRLYVLGSEWSEPVFTGNVSLNPQLSAEASFSPDGKQLAFTYDEQERTGIAIADLESGTVTRLTDGGSYPRWSPAGDWIAFIEAGTIRVIHPDGSGMKSITHDGTALSLTWSPKKTLLAYTTEDLVSFADLEGTPMLHVTDIEPGPVSWSPDGKTFTYASIRGGMIRILTPSPAVVNEEEYLYRIITRAKQQLNRT